MWNAIVVVLSMVSGNIVETIHVGSFERQVDCNLNGQIEQMRQEYLSDWHAFVKYYCSKGENS